MRASCLLLLLAASRGAFAAEAWQPTDGWFTLHHDAMRSGRTQFSPAAPFTCVWRRKFWQGMLSPEAEPIVADGLVFIGDWGGTFYALDALTGKAAWTAQAPGGVCHSPCYADGRICFATIGDRTGGAVVCCNAKTGEKLWEFKPGTRGGFAASPMLCGGRVIIGGRDKVAYCLGAKTGGKLWSFAAGGIYLQTCAARDGRVCVAAEDMRGAG
jgi:outer membrane protein assembly factor BamB